MINMMYLKYYIFKMYMILFTGFMLIFRYIKICL